MRLTANQYAKALYELTLNADNTSVDLAVKNLLKILQKNGQLKLKNEVVKKFGEVARFKSGIVEAEVISRENLDAATSEKIVSFVKNKYKVASVVINNKVRENIKGGLIIQVGDEVMDGSIARNLRNLKNTLAK